MTVPNSDPRKNPSAPKPLPREPLRNAYTYVIVAAVLALTGLVTFGALTTEQIIAVIGTAGAILTAVVALLERARGMLNSPATSAQNAELRDALAQAIVLAEKNGSVPSVGKSLAEDVIKGGIRGAAGPALQAAALALGLPHAFVVAAAPAALQAAMDAVTEASKRAPTGDEAYQRVRDQAAAKQ